MTDHLQDETREAIAAAQRRYQDKLAAIPKSGDLAARLEEEDGLFEEMQAEIARITFPMVRHKIG